MKRVISFFPVLLLIFLTQFVKAQDNPVLDGAAPKEHIVGKTPIAYPYIREADEMYSKKVLRVIEMSEKINHPLYFPITRITYPGGLQPQRSRVNLLYLIYNIGILGEQYDYITGAMVEEAAPIYESRYPVYRLDPLDLTNWYKAPIAKDDPLRDDLLAYEDTYKDYNADGYLIDMSTTARLTDTRDMDRLWFWEEWVFDRQRSVLDVRIIALAPDGWRDDKRIWPFWIPFTDYRPLFSTYETFNPFNDSERRSFDDLFMKRRFTSYIVAETNNYDNRLISDYLLGIDAIREGERIQDRIFTYEHDLWEY